jgi:hypothetical protein
MKIISSVSFRDWKPLRNYHAGTPIRFRLAFHQDNDRGDLFMVNAVTSCYRPDRGQYEGKIAVTHLKTGKLSYVDPERDCTLVEAYVKLEEDGC